jgi:hypothetical protein
MLYNMEFTLTANQLVLIKATLAMRLSTNNPHLAKAIAYRSTHTQLFSSGDLASFYDHYNSYKQELVQNAVAALESLSDRIFEKIKQDQTDLSGHGITQAKVNSVTVDGGTVILNVTLTYTDGHKATINMSLGDIMSWF